MAEHRIEVVVADGQSNNDNPIEVVTGLQEELRATGTGLKMCLAREVRGGRGRGEGSRGAGEENNPRRV